MNHQIELIKDAMQEAGVWSKETPDWTKHYQDGHEFDIWQWLQFIHLPLRISGVIEHADYLAPQLRSYMHADPSHKKILQLVIELDSITPTLKNQNNSD